MTAGEFSRKGAKPAKTSGRHLKSHPTAYGDELSLGRRLCTSRFALRAFASLREYSAGLNRPSPRAGDAPKFECFLVKSFQRNFESLEDEFISRIAQQFSHFGIAINCA